MAKHAATKAPTPLEHKVTSATSVAALVGIAVAVLNGLSDASVLSAIGIPAVYQGIVLAVIPPLVVFLAGYAAPHAPRPDLDEPAAKPITLADVNAAAKRVDSEPDVPTCGH